ncbi:MAG: NUDIX hydrolase [Patescibacteria group bacterium]|jgi:8-oxo-dGTP pyrophosphatase MutT (NUDIX family)
MADKKIIIASGPIIVEDDKVLLNQHGDTTFWKFCGGRVENMEETLIDACKREVKEEMGIEIEILDDTPFLMHTKKQTDDGEVDVILVHYLAKRIGEVKPSEEIDNWDWLDINNLPENELAPNIIPALKHFGFLK